MPRIVFLVVYFLMAFILTTDIAVAGDTISDAFEDTFGHDQIPKAFEDTFGDNKVPNAFNEAFGGNSFGSHRKPKSVQSRDTTKTQ